MVWEVDLKQDGLDNLNLKENKNEQTSKTQVFKVRFQRSKKEQ